MITKIILAIIVLHLIVGFGWLVYKLAPRKGDDHIDSNQEVQNKQQ